MFQATGTQSSSFGCSSSPTTMHTAVLPDNMGNCSEMRKNFNIINQNAGHVEASCMTAARVQMGYTIGIKTLSIYFGWFKKVHHCKLSKIKSTWNSCIKLVLHFKPLIIVRMHKADINNHQTGPYPTISIPRWFSVHHYHRLTFFAWYVPRCIWDHV